LHKKTPLTIPNFPGYFLLAAVIILVYLLGTIYKPFITILIFSLLFATIFYPVFRRIKSGLGGRGRIASVISCFLTFIIIVLPLALFLTLLISEGVTAFFDISEKIQSGYLEKYFLWKEGEFFYDQFQSLLPYLNVDNIDLDLIGKISEAAKNLGSFFVSQLFNFLENIVGFILALIVFFFALYYFFKDGEKILEKIMHLNPLPHKHEQAIFTKFKEVSLAMLFGIFFTAIIQGTLAGIGYWVVGIQNPIFWATATALFSLIPLLGTAIIWVPASIILMVTGNMVGGIGLFLWGMLVVATVDNFIRPYLIEGKAPVHPLMTFLAVLGGIFTFGLKGILFGPIILNLLIAFLHIYEMEYAKLLKVK
jgi:predicted PurR-regulated permease PerM